MTYLADVMYAAQLALLPRCDEQPSAKQKESRLPHRLQMTGAWNRTQIFIALTELALLTPHLRLSRIVN